MALPSGDVVEELIWKITVQAGDASKQIQSFRQQVEEMKAEMRRLAAETGQDFKTVATVLKQEFGEEFKKRTAEIRENIRLAKEEVKKFATELKNIQAGNTGAVTMTRPIAQAGLDKATADLRSYQAELRNVQSQSQKTGQVTSAALRELNAETKAATQSAKLFGIELGTLNNIARIVFGITLFSVAGQALRAITGWLGEAAKNALTFSQSMFQLEVGVRALRRAGVDVTTSQILENLQRINDSVGNLFSQLELVKGAADFSNLIRDLGLTREQIFNLQEAVVKLAVINGRALDDVQRTVALALSSGYTEGLQRLGVSINRLTIAEEANRIGFEGGYVALTEQQRAIATYNLLVQKAAAYADDLTEAQKRLFGELQGTQAQIENLNVQIGDTLLPAQLAWNKALLGFLRLISLVPGGLLSTIRYVDGLSKIIKGLPAVWEAAGKGSKDFAGATDIASEAFKNLTNEIENSDFAKNLISKYTEIRDSIVEIFKSIATSILESVLGPTILTAVFVNIDKLLSGVNAKIKEIGDSIEQSPLAPFFKALGADVDALIPKIKRVIEFILAMRDAIINLEPIEPVIAEFGGFGGAEVDLGESKFSEAQEKLFDVLEKFGKDVVDLDEEVAEKRKKIEADLQKDLLKIGADGVADRLKIERDYQSDLDELERDAANRRADLARDLQRRLDDISSKLEFDLSEAKIRFDFDISETIIKFNQDVAKANEDFRQKEVNRERQYNEELLRLREDYLIDLEDALEVRDARAVLRARRQFILDRERAKRENETNKEKNKQSLEDDLRAAAERRDARIRELQLELQQRQDALKRQADLDRIEAQRRYDQELEDLKLKLQREQYERFIKYIEQKRDQADRERKAQNDRLLAYATELDDLRKFQEDKLRVLGEGLAEQANLLNLSNEEVLKAIKTYFGEDGLVMQVYDAFVVALKELLAQLSNIKFQSPKFKFKNDPDSPKSFARGGAAVASEPTTVQFGEAGPELALFVPMNQIGQLSGLFEKGLGDRVVGEGGGGGKTLVAIDLSPGLVGEIVDQSADAVAEVVFQRNRSRSRL